jgi:hypothetical protein
MKMDDLEVPPFRKPPYMNFMGSLGKIFGIRSFWNKTPGISWDFFILRASWRVIPLNKWLYTIVVGH